MANEEKIIRTAGGVAFNRGVKTAVTAVTGNPAIGEAAGVASAFAPDRAKGGAAAGALLGASAAGHAMSVGTAGAMAFGTAMFLPFVLGGAVVVGGLAWLLGSEDSKEDVDRKRGEPVTFRGSE